MSILGWVSDKLQRLRNAAMGRDKFQACVEINNMLNDRILEGRGTSMSSLKLDTLSRKEWFLNYSRALFHNLVYLESSLCEIIKASREFILVDMFHNTMTLAQISGFDLDDIDVKEIFILNATFLISFNVELSGIMTYYYYLTASSEDDIGWQWWDTDAGNKPNEEMWQSIRDRIREMFSAFSIICLKMGYDYDAMCENYIKTVSGEN